MNKRGFSLLEILVTTTIIALLAVASIPSLSKLENKKGRENAVNLIAGCIAEAKAKAQAPSSYEVDEYQAVINNKGCEVWSNTNNVLDKYNEYLIDSGFVIKEVMSSKPVTVIKFSTEVPYKITAQAQNEDSSSVSNLPSFVFIEIRQTETNSINSIFMNFGTGIITTS